MDALAPILLSVIVLIVVGLAAIVSSADSRDDLSEVGYWRSFGPRL